MSEITWNIVSEGVCIVLLVHCRAKGMEQSLFSWTARGILLKYLYCGISRQVQCTLLLDSQERSDAIMGTATRNNLSRHLP